MNLYPFSVDLLLNSSALEQEIAKTASAVQRDMSGIQASMSQAAWRGANDAAAAFKAVTTEAAAMAAATHRSVADSSMGAASTLQTATRAQLESIRQYSQQAALVTATANGPLAEAIERQKQVADTLSRALQEGRIERQAYQVLVEQSERVLAGARMSAESTMGGPEALLDTLRGGSQGEKGPVSANETKMRETLKAAVTAAGGEQALADSKGVATYEAYEKSMIDAVKAADQAKQKAEQAAASFDAWAKIVNAGVDKVATALTDYIAGGMRDIDKLWDSLRSSAKSVLQDLAKEFVRQKLVLPIQTQIKDGISGSSFLKNVVGLLDGNGAAGGGENAGNIASLLSRGQSPIGFHPGAANLSPGSLMGFGNNISALTGGGTAAAGGAAAEAAGGAATAGATGALGAVAAFAPYAALIAMGMQMAGDAYKEGFGLENQSRSDLLVRGHFASGGLLTPVMLDSMLLDYVGRAVGMSGKTAAVFSGSSLLGKAFGRSAPKITGQGITGSYGFGGLDGQSYADVKQKGGWFRSDKKWTQYGALDSGIDRTFDMAARQVRGATTELARQLGVDLASKLDSVRVDLGRLQLSSDPAEAQKQLEGYLADMQDRLFTEAVKAAGFGGQLDGHFESADVFSAVSASIALAVGNADELGRALDGLEVDKVNQAVDYFQDLARVAGTDLASQIQKVTGLLGSYASLMADVSTQLLSADLSSYQQQALSIERTYRQQVKSANDYAKALGLSGARAEDLAKIEALRAMNMGKLQAQIDKDKTAMQYGLSVSNLSSLTDQEKLGEAMKELERAVSSGDTSAAQAAAQTALGFGRDLYASGSDYSRLYGQVTGLVDSMKVGDLGTEDGTSMGALADAIEALPDNFSRAMFDLVVNNDAQTQTTAAVQQSNALLTDVRTLLQDLLSTTTQGVRTSVSSVLRTSLNA